MDTGRLPWFSIWMRITCDAFLMVGGLFMAYGSLYLNPDNKWFVAYGLLAIAVATIGACSRTKRARRFVTYLLLALVLEVAAITLVAALRIGLNQSVLIAIGGLAAWPIISLLWMVLDRRARNRIDRFASIDAAENAHRSKWWQPIARCASGFVIIVYVPFSIFTLCLLLHSLTVQVESLSWPVTSGTVVQSKLKQETQSAFESEYDLVYQYLVDGKTYRGTRYNGMSPFLVEKPRAQRWADEITVGSTVMVHYRAGNPAQSLLHTGIDAYSSLLFLGLLLPLAIAISMCYLTFDRELCLLLPPERYEPYNTPLKTAIMLGAGFAGCFAALAAGGCLFATDDAPAHVDALAAWTVTLFVGWLIFRGFYRLALRELAEKSAQKDLLLSKQVDGDLS